MDGGEASVENRRKNRREGRADALCEKQNKTKKKKITGRAKILFRTSIVSGAHEVNRRWGLMMLDDGDYIVIGS